MGGGDVGAKGMGPSPAMDRTMGDGGGATGRDVKQNVHTVTVIPLDQIC